MIDDELAARVLQLYQVENLSMRQIAAYCGMCAKTVARIIHSEGVPLRNKDNETIIVPYRRLIEAWYGELPKLKAFQVYERLLGLGFTGSYTTVKRATRKLRAKKPIMYHERVLLPGEEAQVDWMVLTLPWGTVYGFVYVLAWSRYLVLRFYPHMTFEFFLDGHLEAFRECIGIAHAHRYDNLKSVVISRKPVLRLNAQFVDFSRHYGFAIHPCTPYRPNEKGRVERVIRDIRSFLYTQHPKDLADLNRLVDQWQRIRNNTPHSMTGRSPSDASFEEPLKKLPAIAYPGESGNPVHSASFLLFRSGSRHRSRFQAAASVRGQFSTHTRPPPPVFAFTFSAAIKNKRRKDLLLAAEYPLIKEVFGDYSTIK